MEDGSAQFYSLNTSRAYYKMRERLRAAIVSIAQKYFPDDHAQNKDVALWLICTV